MNLSALQYTTLLTRVANRDLGALGVALGVAHLEHLPPAEINTVERVSNFVGQTAHETGGYQWLHELGNAAYFAKYDGRRDLGNTVPGDGFKYRGRGLIQVTGRANYAAAGHALSLDLIDDPDLAAAPDAATAVAVWLWATHGLNALADQGEELLITKRINGGTNGLADRQALTARARQFLSSIPA